MPSSPQALPIFNVCKISLISCSVIYILDNNADKIKANLLNKYFCSISFVDDTNHVPPDIPSRTDALLSNIYITEHDITYYLPYYDGICTYV
jgi:hypothetical protein